MGKSTDSSAYLRDIAGGFFSDWIYDTSEYVVPAGFEAYAFQPESSGATIDTGKWLINKVATTITAGYTSQWIDKSITVGPLTFYRPVTSLTLSAGKGMIYCRKSNLI